MSAQPRPRLVSTPRDASWRAFHAAASALAVLNNVLSTTTFHDTEAALEHEVRSARAAALKILEALSASGHVAARAVLVGERDMGGIRQCEACRRFTPHAALRGDEELQIVLCSDCYWYTAPQEVAHADPPQ